MEKNRLEIIRERFEKYMNKNVGKPDIYVKDIADFYEKEITSLLEEVEGEIEGMKKPSLTKSPKHGVIGTLAINYEWNEAIKAVLQILKSKRN